MEKKVNTISALVNASERLASGDFGARSGLTPGKGELGRLVSTFDRMAQHLEDCERERAQAYQALQASELRYRRLFETAQDGILILDAETSEIDDINPFITHLLGYTPHELLGKKMWESKPFKNIESSAEKFSSLHQEAHFQIDDLELEAADGRKVSVELAGTPYLVGDRKVVQCNLRDIAKRKAAENARNEYSLRLRVLSRKLVEAQESERRHLALELHDEVGQTLTIAQLHLQELVKGTSDATRRPKLAECLTAVDHVLAQVRDMALNLRPSMLDDLGLEAALRWYAKRFATSAGLLCDIQIETLARRLDPVIETECFRIAQEALTNVARHARARHASVQLRQEDGQLHLSVRDDGGGFDVESVRDKAVLGRSLGLLSMEERASLAGGELEFKSAPGQGSAVIAHFPLKWLEEPSAPNARNGTPSKLVAAA